MYKYNVTITQQVLNPNYEEEMKSYGKNTKYGRIYETDTPTPQKFTTGEVLSTVVTEEQFRAMQKALIESFGEVNNASQDENKNV